MKILYFLLLSSLVCFSYNAVEAASKHDQAADTSHPASTSYPASTSHPVSTSHPSSTSKLASASHPASPSHPASTSYPASTSHPVSTSQPSSTSNLASASHLAGKSHPASASHPASPSHPASTSHVPVSLLRSVVSAPLNKLQPSPTAASVLPTTMQRTVFHPVSSPSSKSHHEITVASQACGNFSNDTVAFNEDETSPSLITVKEEEQLKLQCSYCVKSSKQAVSLSWYKEDHVIHNGTHFVITNHGKDLGVPVARQNKDEGLYKCEVNYEKQKTSKFITVIVTKADPNPLLSSVLAQNKSFLSVEVTWHLTDHAVFTAAQVSLKLRLLNCSEWRSYKATNTSQEYGIYRFEHLQPSSVYILNITLHNKHQQTENRAVVFWSAASNSSESDQRLRLLYHVTNRRALGVALGIIGLLVLIMITYACVTWLHSDKRGYSIPPGQMKRNENDENDALFQTDTHLFYNRAFEDDKVDWMDDEILS